MEKYGYVGMLAFTALASFWLEFALKVRVLRRIKQAAQSILPPAIFFLIWDAIAVLRNQWSFDADQVVGIYGPFHLPVEEYLFFIIIPLAAIMTLEAVRKVKIHWKVGDEE
ncbi:MAG TPA: lycopene cyclase domain-containing protein [Candidatus Paceibacterota bacterium]|nr:lycopene cyclase domain-containing protein [Candidatus Paceibacterota bacterium]